MSQRFSIARSGCCPRRWVQLDPSFSSQLGDDSIKRIRFQAELDRTFRNQSVRLHGSQNFRGSFAENVPEVGCEQLGRRG